MPRPQFTLRALLVLILVVAAFFGGMAVQRHLEAPLSRERLERPEGSLEIVTKRDGTTWFKADLDVIEADGKP